MKRIMVAFGFLLLAVPACRTTPGRQGRHDVIQVFPYKDHPTESCSAPAPEARNNNLTDHGGPDHHRKAHVVEIFWGPSWGTGQTPGAVASEHDRPSTRSSARPPSTTTIVAVLGHPAERT